MKFFTYLLGRAPSVDTTPPPITINGQTFEPSDNSALDDLDRSEVPEPLNSAFDLENMYCVIEYCDASGRKTTRRVTMLSLKPGKDCSYLQCVCHERHAVRNFRVDRIEAIITSDGEVFDTHRFFAELLGVQIAAGATPQLRFGRVSSHGTTASCPAVDAREIRDYLRAPLSILIGLAMSDRSVHINEIDRVQAYAEREILSLVDDGHIASVPTLDLLDELCRMIAAMRPQRDTMQRYIEEISGWQEGRLTRLNRAIAEVMIADGKVLVEERTFVEELNVFASATSNERTRMMQWGARQQDGQS